MKQYELTVKILVTTVADNPQDQYREAMWIANYYAEMAMKYKSISADKIVSVEAEAV
jgi:alcohol dehydrogenase class IV